MDPLELSLVRQHADDLRQDARRHRDVTAARCCRPGAASRLRAAVAAVTTRPRTSTQECCA